MPGGGGTIGCQSSAAFPLFFLSAHLGKAVLAIHGDTEHRGKLGSRCDAVAPVTHGSVKIDQVVAAI